MIIADRRINIALYFEGRNEPYSASNTVDFLFR